MWPLALVYDPLMRGLERRWGGAWRAELLAPLAGEVLEVGAGTGANLPFYPPSVERVLLSEEGKISPDDLPDTLAARPAGDGGYRLPPGGVSWEQHEKECLRQALEMAGGNRSRAARFLDLPYKAFLYRLEKHGLAPGGSGEPAP